MSGLTLSAGTLSPAFSAETTNYTASVGSNLTSVDVTPTAADAEATMTVNGSAVASGQAKATALDVGDNTITIQVTAKDGITNKNYIVQITVTSSNGSDGTDGTDGTGGNGSSSGSTTKPSEPSNPTQPPLTAQPTPASSICFQR
ncbi:cadherin-like beta sandwich domain-containing protein [Paenibacillus piri]|uniref:Cadherin-like beta sandwich domain-containing protein n=1 Tax=Paenibacillus piri TaxID=2547395 RepID=A0A4R5KQL9_9BACL|nr:cadherin-like beta sandwich domain-containing protein [Paenibacillus piri]TDF97047.1 cadherin-like beta sandwich domain-containing protein [Paenibacillus piri]